MKIAPVPSPRQAPKKSSKQIRIFEHDGRLVCNSRQVAEKFGKNHDDILRDFRNLDCSKAFNARNFAAITYVDSRNRNKPEVLMTKDGLMFLVMGFTGKLASKFKEKFITAFNEMESVIIPKLLQENSDLKAANAKLLPKPKKPKQPSAAALGANNGQDYVDVLLGFMQPFQAKAEIERKIHCQQRTIARISYNLEICEEAYLLL